VTADRGRQQRAGALRQVSQFPFGVGNDRAAAAKNERTLRLQQCLGELSDRARIGMKPPAARRQFERRQIRGKRRMLHVERQAEHDRLPFAQCPTDGAQRILAGAAGRMQPLRHGADRAHHVGLFDVKIILHRAVRHVAGEHHKRRPAFRRFGNPSQRVGKSRSRMDTDQGEFAARFGIGVGHARGITLVTCGDKFDAGLHQGMGNLEIGGAEQRKAAPRAVAGQIAGDHIGDNRGASAHALPALRYSKKALWPKAIIHVRRSAGSREGAGLKSFNIEYLSLK
jgi:hypothetical protein